MVVGIESSKHVSNLFQIFINHLLLLLQLPPRLLDPDDSFDEEAGLLCRAPSFGPDLLKYAGVVHVPVVIVIFVHVASLLEVHQVLLQERHIVVLHNDLEIVEGQLTIAAKWGVCLLELLYQCSDEPVSCLSHFDC